MSCESHTLGLHPETTHVSEVNMKGASRTLAILALLLLVLTPAMPTSAGRLPPTVLPPDTTPYGWEPTIIRPPDLVLPTATVLPPNTNPYGASYNEWGARWWQWVLGQPKDRNPLTDETGVFCAIGQNGPVWFLSGGVATRKCVVPDGKALFFPVATESYVLFPWDPNDTPQLGRDLTKADIDTAFNMSVDVDGTSLPNLETYRAQSPALGSVPETFIVDLPENNLDDIPAGPYQTVADGFYVMLAPLPVGIHNVRIRANFYVIYPDHRELAVVDALYTLLIPSSVVYLPMLSR